MEVTPLETPLSLPFLPSSLEPTQLSLISCSQCMRKVGLWGFQQIESSLTDLEASCGLTSSPIPGAEGRPEHFPLVPESPRRMMTRSQDSTVSPSSEQVLASSGCHCHSGLELGGRLPFNPISKPVYRASQMKKLNLLKNLTKYRKKYNSLGRI